MHEHEAHDTVHLTNANDAVENRSENVAEGVKEINDVKVIAREPAKLWNVVKQDNVVLSTVNMVLLENEAIVFECNHPNGAGCDYVRDNVRSVLAHQRAHSAQILLKKAEQELAERRRRQVDGAKKGAATRAANKAAATNGATPVAESIDVSESVTDESIAVTLDAVEDVAKSLEKAIADLDAAVLQLRIDIQRLKLQGAKPNKELQEKAAKYDALKGILG